MELGFDFKCCWTCKYSILDIGIKAVVCHKTGRIISQMNEHSKEHRPTECGLYEQ